MLGCTTKAYVDAHIPFHKSRLPAIPLHTFMFPHRSLEAKTTTKHYVGEARSAASADKHCKFTMMATTFQQSRSCSRSMLTRELFHRGVGFVTEWCKSMNTECISGNRGFTHLSAPGFIQQLQWRMHALPCQPTSCPTNPPPIPALPPN